MPKSPYIAVKPGTPKNKNPNYIPYYPSKKYIEKNWAPEYVPIDALRSLAKAEKTAKITGVLSPALASSLLPLAMVEGRPDDYGWNAMMYPRSQQLDQTFKKMGLSVGDPQLSPPAESEDWGDLEWAQWEAKQKNRPNIGYFQPQGQFSGGYIPLASEDNPLSLDVMAKTAAVALAHKARLYGDEMAIERWNGVGRLAENHARKVALARAMLSDPANQRLMQAYQGLLSE